MHTPASVLHTSTTRAAAPASVAAAIDRFVAATFARYEAALCATVPGLVEPRVTDPVQALRATRNAVERLVGLAVGTTIRIVATVLRRGFGDATRAAVAIELARIVREGGATGRIALVGEPRRFLRAGDPRPLVEELGARLAARLRAAIVQSRRHVAALVAACPEAAHAIAGLLDLLATEEAPTLAYADHIRTAWSELLAPRPVVEPAPYVMMQIC